SRQFCRTGAARWRGTRGVSGGCAACDRRPATSCAQPLSNHRRDLGRRGVAALESVWAGFHIDQVFRADALSMLRSGVHWGLSLMSGGYVMQPPRALFNNNPLRELLERNINWEHLQKSIREGALRALALCATSYSSADSVAFFDGVSNLGECKRQQRVGRRQPLTLDHLMASMGIPFLFPPVKLGGEHYGDGAQRQLWPLSPAIHLGADRLLIIGV